jgi:phosphatidylserine/phosphatidylglycerophosphate/cardiolipin synthase-like enzyme
MRAARRGVRVRVMLDGFGSRALPKAFVRSCAPRRAVQLFRPSISWITLRRTACGACTARSCWWTAHRVRGGLNILDDATENPTGGVRLDYAVQVEGPLLAQIHAVVHRSAGSWRRSPARRRQPAFARRRCAPTRGRERGRLRASRQRAPSRTTSRPCTSRGIRGARREIVIACAYFMPGWRVRRALMAAARRGVRVVLLLQGGTDHTLFQQASRVLYEALLERGIEIFRVRAPRRAAREGGRGRRTAVGDRGLRRTWTRSASSLAQRSQCGGLRRGLPRNRCAASRSMPRDPREGDPRGGACCGARRGWGARLVGWALLRLMRALLAFGRHRRQSPAAWL